jgi:hypothetical protein
MPSPSIAESLRRIGARTAGGVRKARVILTFGGGAVVQDGATGSVASTTTDEPIRAGDSVWIQPTQRTAGVGGTVIHGRR